MWEDLLDSLIHFGAFLLFSFGGVAMAFSICLVFRKVGKGIGLVIAYLAIMFITYKLTKWVAVPGRGVALTWGTLMGLGVGFFQDIASEGISLGKKKDENEEQR